MTAALAAQGIGALWRHQVIALEQVAAGRHVLLATPTASGKSLVFQLPVLAEGARGGPGRALFLFPLKALGQDQRGKLEALAAAAGLTAEVTCAVYDGDTPTAERAKLRRTPPRVLVTNPDMLHAGILAAWPRWQGFLRDLRWIVVDELHVDRGLFGAHVHHVLRRLLRLARSLGAAPVVVAASATASDPGRFAEALVGEPFAVVERTGAPRAGRHLLLLRPEGSPYTAALALLVELMRREQRVIVFTKARRATELMHSWLRRQDRELAARVSSYRAGFLPEERRRIESALFTGELQGVIATSALELGIDIGGLDACILVGYPGSVMATWQRSGRVGRAGRESVTALVALPDALDQYLLDHPEALFERPCERIVLDPGNAAVARPHLLCAASEMPLRPDTEAPYLARHAALLARLERERCLKAAAGGGLVAVRRAPHRAVNLRGSASPYTIVDAADGRRIGSIDGVRVFHECHPGAIYLHGGRQWEVTELRVGERTVVARRVEVEHYTAALAEKETEILELFGTRHEGGLQAGPRGCWCGNGWWATSGNGSSRRRSSSSCRWSCPRWSTSRTASSGRPADARGSAARVGPPRGRRAARGRARDDLLLPLVALCDRNDLGGISTPFHRSSAVRRCSSTRAIREGSGSPSGGSPSFPSCSAGSAHLLQRCPCDDGCPACVQSPKRGNGNRPLDKRGALAALGFWLSAGTTPALEVKLEPAHGAEADTPVPMLAGRHLQPPASRPGPGIGQEAGCSDGPTAARVGARSPNAGRCSSTSRRCARPPRWAAGRRHTAWGWRWGWSAISKRDGSRPIASPRSPN